MQWEKTKYPGVRRRKHPSRMCSQGKPDYYFALHYKVGGASKDEGVGWTSEGWTAERAFQILATIRGNIRSGSGPTTRAELRALNEALAADAARARKAKEKAAITFAKFCELHYLPVARDMKKPRAMEAECGAVKKWLAPALGDCPLQQIDIAKIEAVIVRMQKAKKRPGTIARVVGVFSVIWNWAVSRGFVHGDSPSRRARKPQQDNQRRRYLTREEAQTLLEALAKRSTDVHDEALIALLCGLRAGEIHALKWSDIDVAKGEIFIRDPKNGKDRYAYMTEEVKAVFRTRRNGQAKSDYIFPSRGGGLRRWVPDTFERTVAELGLNDGVTDARDRVVFHTLRHTFASHLVMQGKPLSIVAELMGHSTIAMTQRYAHLSPAKLRSAVEGLEGFLDPQPAKIIPFAGGA